MKEISIELVKKEIVKNVNVSIGGENANLELRLTEDDDPKEFYNVFLQKDDRYVISKSNFNRIMKSIEDGVKFIQINDDVININDIRKFKKSRSFQ